MRIDPRLSAGPAANLPKAKGEEQDFGELLKGVLEEVNQSQQNAGQMQAEYLAGKPIELHDMMIALERASVSMQLTMQVRNKLLEAWQEIQRTQI